jgi:hypothetical protein
MEVLETEKQVVAITRIPSRESVVNVSSVLFTLELGSEYVAEQEVCLSVSDSPAELLAIDEATEVLFVSLGNAQPAII